MNITPDREVWVVVKWDPLGEFDFLREVLHRSNKKIVTGRWVKLLPIEFGENRDQT